MGIGMIIAVFTLSLMPMPVDTELPENGDKLGHFLMYGTLMFWFSVLYPGWRSRLALAVAFCAMGTGIEYLQGMTDYRSYDLADMAANSVGVLLGWCTVFTPLQNCFVWIEALIRRKGEV